MKSTYGRYEGHHDKVVSTLTLTRCNLPPPPHPPSNLQDAMKVGSEILSTLNFTLALQLKYFITVPLPVYIKVHIDYFIESATYGFLFTSCKTLENSLVRCAHSFVFQSLETSE